MPASYHVLDADISDAVGVVEGLLADLQEPARWEGGEQGWGHIRFHAVHASGSLAAVSGEAEAEAGQTHVQGRRAKLTAWCRFCPIPAGRAARKFGRLRRRGA